MQLICSKPTIMEFDISGLPISIEGAKILAQIIESRPIKKLNISSCRLDDKSLAIILEAAGRSKTLEKVDISRNQLGPNAATSLQSVLRENKNIKKLKMNSVKMTNNSAKITFSGLQNNSCLKKLELEDIWNGNYPDKFGDEGFIYLCEMLAQNTTLTHLSFNQNGLSENETTISIKSTQALAAALQVNATLQYLGLRFCAINPDMMKSLFVGFSDNRGVETLDLSCNKINEDALQTLYQSLKDNRQDSKLKHLNLWSSLTDTGNSLGLLVGLDILESLNIAQNSLYGSGMQVFSDSIGNTKKLQELTMYSFDLAEEGMAKFSEGLLKNTSLKKASFSSGVKAWGEAIWSIFISGLEHNRSIEDISISIDKGLTQEQAKKFFEVIHNTTLKNLCVYGMTNENHADFMISLRNHTSLQTVSTYLYISPKRNPDLVILGADGRYKLDARAPWPTPGTERKLHFPYIESLQLLLMLNRTLGAEPALTKKKHLLSQYQQSRDLKLNPMQAPKMNKPVRDTEQNRIKFI